MAYAIKKGSDYFNTVTYTGNGTAVASGGNSITSLDFQPDFVWIKDRTSTYHHNISDVIRGPSTRVYSSLTNAEDTNTESVNSFDSNGFTVGNNVGVNTSGNDYVAWNWKGGESTVENTDGTLTSNVSVNTTSGFSVVTYTGNATTGATVGHGLGVAPSMIITKNRDTTTDWWVYHSALGNTKYMVLNTTAAAVTSSTAWNNTSPTSTVFTLGGAGNPSNANQDVAYCFAEVEGFSKFGSYTGNGSTDGPFVYTGFRPAFLLVKKSSGTGGWAILDTARDTYNAMYQRLEADSSGAEVTSATYLDTLSNGFKIRTTNGTYNGAFDYIYMAFAETPFKYSNAR